MAAGLSEVQGRIAAAAARCGRSRDEILLVAVSKGVLADGVVAAYRAGIRDFGENRAEGLLTRAANLPPDVRLHFIGRLQGNKVARVRPHVHLLHSLDRPDLVDYWSRGTTAAPPVLVEVNPWGDPAKAGVSPSDAAALVERARRSGLDVTGLMTMAPLGASEGEVRRGFEVLRWLRERLVDLHPGLIHLSMGMTDDYEVAVEEGATILRVGRAIFGPSPNEG